MTREEVEAQPWFGEQREKVLGLVDRAERAEAQLVAAQAAFDSKGFARALVDMLSADRRVELAVYLCEGTSQKVVPR